jgi:signal transduction histidine kinase/ligand-binding sensor domain-containing protein
VQTSDGYLWIGTPGALFRFDGVRFVPWSAPEGQKLPSDYITALAPSKDGGLWIGTSSGLAHWTGHDFISFAPGGRIDRVIVDPQGNAWIARARTRDSLGPLCEVVGSVLQCHRVAEGILENNAGQLAQDAMGNFWIGITDKLVRWRPGSSTIYPIQGLKTEAGLSGVQDIVANQDNSLWVGMDRSGRSLGLQRFANGQWNPLVTPTFNSSTLEVGALFLDRNGDLWVGTVSKGIYRIHDRQIDHFDSSDGLSGNSVNGFLQDREGNIWVATSSGVDSFRDLPVATFSTRQGLSSDRVGSIVAAHDGTIWIGTIGSLDSIRAGRVSSISASRGLPGQEVTAMLEDKKGRLWVGVDNALYLYGNSRFARVPGFEGKPAGLVFSLAESADHTVWGAGYFSPSYRLVRFADGKAKQKFEPPQMARVYRVEGDPRGGVWVSFVGNGITRYQDGTLDNNLLRETATLPKLNNFFVDADGSAWMGTTGGLAVWKQGTLRLLTTRNGLPCDTIYSLLRDAHQALWLYSHCGLVRIERAEIDRWWANPNDTIKALTLDAFCGAQPALATFAPAAGRSPDGRLWFTNDSVVQMVDPDDLDLNPTPPPVHVEQVLAQGNSYTAQDRLQLPPHTRDIQIDYAALSFVSPQGVRFRVMLRGHDLQWMDVGTRRSAFYTNLGPGEYHFQVIACNNDGIWNEVGAHLDFRIAPAWYQTNWFRIACVAALLGLMWGLYQLRLQQLRRQFSVRLEERVHERTRIARELHDTLLQSLHGLMFEFQAARNMFRKRPEEALQALDGALMGTERAITESQEAIENLRNTANAEADLPQLIKMAGEDLVASRPSELDSPTFGLTVEGQPRALSPSIRDEIYRIARELLRNAFRHAQAPRIEAEILYEEDRLLVRVRDDGRGIDPHVLEEGRRPGHWGLPGVRERAQQISATLEIWSEPGAGTEVQLAVSASIAYQKTSARARFAVFQRTENHEHRT